MSYEILSTTDATKVGDTAQGIGPNSTFQVDLGGRASSTVKIEVSNDNKIWLELGIIENAGGIASLASWQFYRANLTASSGAGTLKVWMN